MKGQECGSSQYICIEHFTPDDYVVSKDRKKVCLKTSAIPSIFSVFLIELKESENLEIEFGTHKLDSHHKISGYATEKNAEIHEITLQKENLHQELERFKRENESEKLVAKARIEYYKGMKQQQAKEIIDLKQQIEHLKNSNDQLKKERNVTFPELNVNICIYFELSHSSSQFRV